MSIQSLFAGALCGFGFVGMVYFTHLGDPMMHRPAFYMILAVIGCLIFCGRRKA